MSAGSVEVAPVPSPKANVINTNTTLSNKLAAKNEKTPAAAAFCSLPCLHRSAIPPVGQNSIFTLLTGRRAHPNLSNLSTNEFRCQENPISLTYYILHTSGSNLHKPRSRRGMVFAFSPVLKVHAMPPSTTLLKEEENQPSISTPPIVKRIQSANVKSLYLSMFPSRSPFRAFTVTRPSVGLNIDARYRR